MGEKPAKGHGKAPLRALSGVFFVPPGTSREFKEEVFFFLGKKGGTPLFNPGRFLPPPVGRKN